MLLQLFPLVLFFVDCADREKDAGRLARLSNAVVLDVEVIVLDRLLIVAEAAPEEGGILERIGGLLLARILARELLVELGRLAVVGDAVKVLADLIKRLLRLGR